MHALTLPIMLALTTVAAAQPARQTPPRAEVRLKEESVQSAALGRAMRYRVLVPENYDASLRRYPVLYLLHGLTGDYKDWTTRTNLAEYTRSLPLIVVMPDGENSWYTNSADDPSSKFETYVLVDLVADVEEKYRAIRSRYGRAIGGLSMGGYGAMKLALKRPALFMFAASFSGALGVSRDGEFGSRLGAEGDRIKQIFGPADSETRKTNDVFALAAAAKPAAMPYLYLDCGTADSLLASNRELAAALHKAGVAYEFHEVPGAHTWDYWDARIREVLPLLIRRLSPAP
jgi:S-formylglutathione hydrolase FrmB